MAAKKMGDQVVNGVRLEEQSFVGTLAEQATVDTSTCAPGSTYWDEDNNIDYVWNGAAWKAK